MAIGLSLSRHEVRVALRVASVGNFFDRVGGLTGKGVDYVRPTRPLSFRCVAGPSALERARITSSLGGTGGWHDFI